MPRVYYHAMAAQLTRLLVFFGGLTVEEVNSYENHRDRRVWFAVGDLGVRLGEAAAQFPHGFASDRNHDGVCSDSGWRIHDGMLAERQSVQRRREARTSRSNHAGF